MPLIKKITTVEVLYTYYIVYLFTTMANLSELKSNTRESFSVMFEHGKHKNYKSHHK